MKSHDWRLTMAVSLCLCMASVTLTHAASPKLIPYQGRLTDDVGAVVPDGNYSLLFKIWSASTGGSLLWSESQNVAVADGLFSILLGSSTLLDDDVLAIGGGNPDPSDRYVEITVGTEVLSPRTQLATVPYSVASRRLSGDLFTGTRVLDIRSVFGPMDLPRIRLVSDSALSEAWIWQYAKGDTIPEIVSAVNDSVAQVCVAYNSMDVPGLGYRAMIDLGVGPSCSNVEMIGGGNPDPSNAPRLNLEADGALNDVSIEVHAKGDTIPEVMVSANDSVSRTCIAYDSFFSPDPNFRAMIDMTSVASGSNFVMIGGGTPDPSDSPEIKLTTNGVTNEASMALYPADPNELAAISFRTDGVANDGSVRFIADSPTAAPAIWWNVESGKVREALYHVGASSNDSSGIELYTTSGAAGIDLHNTSGTHTVHIGDNGVLASKADAGSTAAVPIGSRVRDNGIVAWASVSAAGALSSDFGVLAISHPTTGQYVLTLNNSAAGSANLIPLANALVGAIPISATSARLVTVNRLSVNSLAVYITNGGYAAVDNDFVFLATAR